MNHLTKTAQELRKNMTREECHLWYDFLRQLPITFHKKKVIGNYIADFYSASKKLVIDVNKAIDAERDRYLIGLGLTVLYFSNEDISQRFEDTCEKVYDQIKGEPFRDCPQSVHPNEVK